MVELIKRSRLWTGGEWTAHSSEDGTNASVHSDAGPVICGGAIRDDVHLLAASKKLYEAGNELMTFIKEVGYLNLVSHYKEADAKLLKLEAALQSALGEGEER